jgi:hypothetical protein
MDLQNRLTILMIIVVLGALLLLRLVWRKK